MEIIKRITSKSAPAVTAALEDVISAYPNKQDVFQSITADNGSAFSELADQGRENQIDVYFAHPYASWERGSNERHNNEGKALIFNQGKYEKLARLTSA